MSQKHCNFDTKYNFSETNPSAFVTNPSDFVTNSSAFAINANAFEIKTYWFGEKKEEFIVLCITLCHMFFVFIWTSL